jgi:hypothetical protein
MYSLASCRFMFALAMVYPVLIHGSCWYHQHALGQVMQDVKVNFIFSAIICFDNSFFCLLHNCDTILSLKYCKSKWKCVHRQLSLENKISGYMPR